MFGSSSTTRMRFMAASLRPGGMPPGGQRKRTVRRAPIKRQPPRRLQCGALSLSERGPARPLRVSPETQAWVQAATWSLASRPQTISRPLVSPTYAQGSYYGTRRVVSGAPGRLAGPATRLQSTTRAARPSGRDHRGSRSSVARTGRVSRYNRARGRSGAGARERDARAVPAPWAAAATRRARRVLVDPVSRAARPARRRIRPSGRTG